MKKLFSSFCFRGEQKLPLFGASCVGLLLLIANSANAQLIIEGEEIGPDVIFTISGSLSPGVPLDTGSFLPETIVSPVDGRFEAWQTTSDVEKFALDADVPFGAGGNMEDVGVGTGDNIAILMSEIILDDTYVAGTPLNATLTFSGADFASLGIDVSSGPYVWTVTETGATITLQFPIDNSALIASLKSKIKKFKRKVKIAKRKGQRSKAKRLQKKLRKLQRTLRALS